MLNTSNVMKPGQWVESVVTGVKLYERVIPPINSKGKPFLIMETQVTQALYEAVMGTNPSEFKGKPDSLQRPVEQVSWEDGVKFANALSEKLGLRPAYEGSDNNARMVAGANGFRLPFEVEWVWAAKGGEEHEYAGSDNLDEVSWYDNNSSGETHPVQQLRSNKYGLFDMSGNVWEWCADDYEKPGQYHSGASQRVIRGGCWYDGVGNCRMSYQGRSSPDSRYYVLGLRLSRSLD